MSIFNFLNKKNEDANMVVPMMPAINLPEQEFESNDVENTASGSESSTKSTLTVSYATGWPIDVIYGYLHKNYEEKGFNDAMVKSDLAFRDINMNIIRNKILIIFREVNLNYDVMRKDIETRMETCSAAGLLTTLSDLENQASIINAHKAELEKLEQDFRSNANEASVPLQSYDCGFLRGIATIALSTPQKRAPMSQSMVTPSISQEKATA